MPPLLTLQKVHPPASLRFLALPMTVFQCVLDWLCVLGIAAQTLQETIDLCISTLRERDRSADKNVPSAAYRQLEPTGASPELV